MSNNNAHAQEVAVKEMVFEHLEDAYKWHITNWGEKEISVHLPVIVKTKGGGWHIFSSSRLDNGTTHEGFYISTEGKYKGKIVTRSNHGESRPFIDISLTKNALALILNGIILLISILPLAGWYKKGSLTAPKGFRGTVELAVVYVTDEIIKPCIGADYRKYTTYLLTIFFFILINNVMGLIPFFPGGANVTGNIAVTMFLAICTFFVINISGTKAYWKEILWPDVPTWLKVPAPIMPVIELFGIITKPFALMIRLFANIMAGHSVILGLLCLIFITASMGTVINAGMSFVAIVFSVFMNCLELLVAFIQAYVFTLLSAVFIGMARARHP
jgi:F-type H+-transporting ATPase subunit a